jgi:DNA repair exonuclease SbcCD ATPase subunit
MERVKIDKLDRDRTEKNKFKEIIRKDDEDNEEDNKKIKIDFIFKDLEYDCKIKYVYQISDVHIQLYKRHDEYKIQFNKFYDYLKSEKEKYDILPSENKNIPLICCMTGDILHSKTDLSPECVQVCYQFLRDVSSIMPVVLIPGNHDLNMNNKDRLDSITPIIADLPNVRPVYYLKDTGLYLMHNVLFSHSSIFDYKIITDEEIDKAFEDAKIVKKSNLCKVVLYHGRLDGVVLFNKTSLAGEKDSNNKTITPSSFDNYNICMFGDIHKHQFIRPNMAYSGSFMQQNMGEDINNHGIIKWNIKKNTGKFVPFECDYAFVTINIKDKKADYMCIKKEGGGKHIDNCKLKKNLRVRILYQNTPIPFVNDYLTILKYNHNVIEYTFQNNDDILGTDRNKEAEKTKKLTDITQASTQNHYIEAYLREHTDADDKDIEMIKLLNVSQNKLLCDQSKNKIQQIGNFKIIDIEFHNLFSYGSNNYIKFTDFEGVVGIIAPNHIGKSALLDIILYTLYDKVSRKGSARDIINNRKQNFAIKMNIEIGEWIYHIEKYGTRTKKGANVKLIFNRKKKGKKDVEHLEDDSVVKTKKIISDYFGSYDDIVNTSFSIQDNNATFINAENTQRRKELERILKLGFIEDLIKHANLIYNKNKHILDHIEKKINQDKVIEILKDKKNLEKELTENNNNKKSLKLKLASTRDVILEKTKKIVSLDSLDCSDPNEIEKEQTDLDRLNKKGILSINNIKSDYQKFLKHITKKQFNKYIEKVKIKVKRDDNDMPNFNGLDKEIKLIDKLLHLFNDLSKQNIKKVETIREELDLLREQKGHIQHLSLNHIDGISDSKHITVSLLNSLIDDKRLGLGKGKDIESSLEDELCQKDKMIKKHKKLIKDKNHIDSESLPDTMIKEYKNHKSLKTVFGKAELSLIDCIHDCDNEFSIDMKQYIDYKSAFNKFAVSTEVKKYVFDTDSKKYKTLVSDIEQMESNLNRLDTKKDEKYNISLTNQRLEKEIIQINDCMDIVASNEKIEANNKDIINKIKETKQKQCELEKKVGLYNDYKKVFENCKDLIVKIKVNSANYNDLKESIRVSEEKVSGYSDYIKQKSENDIIEKAIVTLKSDLEDYEEEIENLDSEIGFINKKIVQYSVVIEQFKKDDVEKKKIAKKVRLNELYKNSLKQLPYTIINKITPYIEKKINDLLSLVTDFSVKMEVNESKIEIYLNRSIYNGNMIMLSNSSGFEKFISSLAIRIALLEITNLPKLNFIAIDEGFAAFDTHNINNVRTIFDFLCSKFDFVLMMTHLDHIKQYVDTQINIKKDARGFSNVRIE